MLHKYHVKWYECSEYMGEVDILHKKSLIYSIYIHIVYSYADDIILIRCYRQRIILFKLTEFMTSLTGHIVRHMTIGGDWRFPVEDKLYVVIYGHWYQNKLVCLIVMTMQDHTPVQSCLLHSVPETRHHN